MAAERSLHAIAYRLHFDLKKRNVSVRCSFLMSFAPLPPFCLPAVSLSVVTLGKWR